MRELSQVAIAATACFLFVMAAVLPFIGPADGQSAATCVKYPGGPVLVAGSGGSWDSGGDVSPSVILNGTSFYMLFTGTNSSYTSSIGLAASADGVNWTKRADPVLQVGANGTWDSESVYFPAVIWNGTEYMMYYTGYNQTEIGIGVAFSKDLVHWQKYAGNPVLLPGPGAYDSVSVTSHTVMFDPPAYKMWYSGRYPVNYTHSIGYATSTDGLHWAKYSGNPVITRSTNNDSHIFGPWGPTVGKVGSEYFAAYETDGRVSSATSYDGIHWTASAAPLLRSSDLSETGYAIENPWMLLKNSTAYLWYTIAPFSGAETTAIGFAFCALSPLVHTTTITSVSATTQATTVVTHATVVETVIRTSTLTEQGSATSLTIYQASTAVLAVLLVTSIILVFARHKRVA